jgi:hypothetical protein
MMHWYWRVRIYNKAGHYWHGQIITGRNLREIDGIQDFYAVLTGCKMLLEGMSEQEDPNLGNIQDAFMGLWALPPSEREGPS